MARGSKRDKARGSKRGERGSFFGPWLGMEERENFQTEEHCQLALNVDFHRGYIEGRKGFSYINTKGYDRMRLHTVKVNGKPRFILGLGVTKRDGVATEKQEVHYIVYSSNGKKVYKEGILVGEPPDPDFMCQFADTIIAKDMDGDGIKETPRHVTLVYTKRNLWVFDPEGATLTPTLADMEGDSVTFNSINWGYWKNRPEGAGPFGPIMTEHLGSIWYAGFGQGFSTSLTSPIHENQSQIPETWIDQNDRSRMPFGPEWVAWSDPFDPLGIVAYQFLAVEEMEAITGLKSFQEQLVIFTDRSIYVLTGGDVKTYSLFKAVSGVGCVAPNSIVEAGGILYFMARDGIYAFGGMGAESRAQKVSKPIDSIFSGDFAQTHMPATIAEDMANMGWPFAIRKNSMMYSNVIHVQTKNQIWWSIDIKGTKPGSFAVTLVYDYYHGAWSLYEPTGVAKDVGASYVSDKASCMYDGTVVLENGEEYVYTSTTREKSPGSGQDFIHALLRYGSGRDDDNHASNPIPFIYLTGRLFKSSSSASLFRPIRLKMLSWGNLGDSDHGPEWFAEGEEAHADGQQLDGSDAVELSTEGQATSGSIPLHPTDGSATTLELFYSSNAKYGVGRCKYQERDWFTSKLEPASIRSRSLRVGFRSGFTTTAANVRAPELVIQGIIVDVEVGDTR